MVAAGGDLMWGGSASDGSDSDSDGSLCSRFSFADKGAFLTKNSGNKTSESHKREKVDISDQSRLFLKASE